MYAGKKLFTNRVSILILGKVPADREVNKFQGETVIRRIIPSKQLPFKWSGQ